jgi:hypothetical protein
MERTFHKLDAGFQRQISALVSCPLWSGAKSVPHKYFIVGTPDTNTLANQRLEGRI